MMRILTILSVLFTLPMLLFSQKTGYQIKVKIEGYEQRECYLGYYFGDKQYLKDTAYLEQDGYFYFEGNEELPGGIYLVVMPPDNQFFQLLVDKGNQWFSMETKYTNTAENMKIKNSPDNQLFYDYLNFLSQRRPEADELRKQVEEAANDAKKKAKAEEKLNALDKAVEAYQKNIVTKYPSSMTAAVIRANMPLQTPEFDGDEQEKQRQAFYWTRQHWFDHIDLGDPRIVRTPFLFQKIDHYVQKMTVQHPDSINLAIDRVLELARPSEETFKFYLIHFLNSYAKSNYVGMDAVYVHIALKYYAAGQAPWTEEEQLVKIIDNAKRLEPLLIGKTAPNIEMQTKAGEKIWLHDFRAPFTVLFFWDPECGHCKKSMPEMVQFAKDFKSKGVSVFAVCTKLVTRDDQGNFSMKEVDSCWSTIQEREMDVFFNTVDPYHRSRYKTIYDIKTTPQIYVLDANKKILSKRIGAEQLPEVMNHFIEAKEKR